jgi:hypothetical protein
MSIKPWKVLETSYFRPRFRIDKCELSNGNLLDATIFEFYSWANIVALTKNGEVVLVKQYRHGVCEALLEFPGGVWKTVKTQWMARSANCWKRQATQLPS